MSVLAALMNEIQTGKVKVIDLTAPLSNETPVLELPEQFGQTARFELEEISHYDDRGPAWYWNNFRTGEHTGTHFDAPNHWLSGKGLADVASVPVGDLIAPAVVLDVTEEVSQDPGFIIEEEHIKEFEQRIGSFPQGGWLLCRTGWSVTRQGQTEMINNTPEGPLNPGLSAAAAEYVAKHTPLQGLGVETVGTDAGAAAGFDPIFPCHDFFMGEGKYGLAQLQNLDQLPTTGAVIVASPLKIVTGSGSPARVIALVEE